MNSDGLTKGEEAAQEKYVQLPFQFARFFSSQNKVISKKTLSPLISVQNLHFRLKTVVL